MIQLFFGSPNIDNNTAIFMIGSVVIIAVLACVGAVSHQVAAQKGKVVKYTNTWKQFKVKCYAAGLQHEGTVFFQRLIKDTGCQDPVRLLNDAEYLRVFCRRAIANINRSAISNDVKEIIKFRVFFINRVITKYNEKIKDLVYTKNLKLGTELDVSLDTEKWVAATLLSSEKSGATIEFHTKYSSLDEWKKSKEVYIRTIASPNERNVFTFKSKILRILPNTGNFRILVQHTENIPEKQQRNFPRRKGNTVVTFKRVTVHNENKGGKRNVKDVGKLHATIDDTRVFQGRLNDLSAGGCAIVSAATMTKDILLKLEFKIEDESITAFGRICAIVPMRGVLSTLRIKFTRITRKHINAIQSYVHEVT